MNMAQLCISRGSHSNREGRMQTKSFNPVRYIIEGYSKGYRNTNEAAIKISGGV